jgi:hypothetical protein
MASIDHSGLERAAFLSDPTRARNRGIRAPTTLPARSIAAGGDSTARKRRPVQAHADMIMKDTA